MSGPPVVSALIETFTSMLAEKVLKEVSLITSFKKDFEFLCDELFSVKLLLDEVGQNSNSPSMSNWLQKLEDFLIDAMDIVEDCQEISKFGNLIFCKFDRLIFRYKMGRRMRTLREGINEIHGSAKYLKHLMSVLQVDAFTARSLEDKRERFTAQESQMVGREYDIAEITKLILRENGPQVIAVVGMGGIGKTLLVQSVFKSQKVQESFQCPIWQTASENLDVKRLRLQIARNLNVSRGENQNVQNATSDDNSVQNQNLSNAQIRSKIMEDLEKNRSLFVLDDLWDKDDFHKFGLSLLKRTKIIVTTRDQRLVNSTPPPYIYSLNCLSQENSMKLFCIHAFPKRVDTNYSLPDDLKRIAENIVEKCGRLPLAVKTIAASMARLRRIPNDWESVLNGLNEAEAMSHEVRPSLRLSYEALPNHLKLCFDYCSCFPKDSRLKTEYLVHAWIDEGFTPQTAENPYAVGLSYIDELIDRCLLEVSKVGGDGRVKYCKMHDLLHDLAVSESHKKTRCLLMPGKELKEFPVGKCRDLRRVSFIENNITTIGENIRCPRLRTLMLGNNLNLQPISKSVFHHMKYLAVLDLSHTPIDSLPESVGCLKHLKFLNLSQTKIKKLPKSLAELRRLQFLDVSQCEDLCELHSGIGEHRSMLHLNVKGSHNLELLPVGISKLINLHTLKGLVFKSKKDADSKAFQSSALWKRGKAANARALELKDLKRMTLLQHLSLTLEDEASSSEGFIQLENGTFEDMTSMRAFSFKYVASSQDSCCRLRLPEDIKVMERLEILHLKRCVVQDWIFGLQNLMELELHGDNSETEKYKGLETIPNLRKLKLSSNEECVVFPEEFGADGAFPKLENLVIKRFDSLENLPLLNDGALPMLKCLQMKYCNQLNDITEALQRKTRILEEIRVKGCPGWEEGIWKRDRTWQLLKDGGIKLTINGYTICWENGRFKNSIVYGNYFQEREKIGFSLRVYGSALAFIEAGASSAETVAE